MAGAGVLIKLLFGFRYDVSVILVGLGMIVYVAAGGILPTLNSVLWWRIFTRWQNCSAGYDKRLKIRHSPFGRPPCPHFRGSESVRDVVIGMADGLTVPFALAAGLTAAVTSSRIIVTAGLAEIAAGAIAMGLGGYLAARTDQEHYLSEEQREYKEIQQLREVEIEEVATIFSDYGVKSPVLDQVTNAIAADPKRWVDFMMRFELGLERPDPKRAPISALTIAVSYIIGGLIPLAPYIFGAELHRALIYSVVLTGVALAIFGAVKGKLTGISMVKSAAQTTLVGGVAATAAFYLASLFS